jgi:hypothetical protein
VRRPRRRAGVHPDPRLLAELEIYFSILQRKVITPTNAADLDELAARLLAFQQHYNATAEPFDWTFTSTKLNALLDRLATRTNPHQHAA